MNLKIGDVLSFYFHPEIKGIILNYVKIFDFDLISYDITMYMLDSNQIETYAIVLDERSGGWNKIT
jgi:hypothetical protein